MRRLGIALFSFWGLRLSVAATLTIKRMGETARSGNQDAARHFTQTRYARVFGVRNSDLGIVWYTGLALAALCGDLDRRRMRLAARAGSAASVCLSLYLLWALLVRLRTECRVCLQAHGVNLALFVLLWAPERRPAHHHLTQRLPFTR